MKMEVLWLKLLIINVEEDPSYPNLAIAGKTYNLIPNFQLDDNKKIISDSEKNKSLSFLSKQKTGYEFKAIIFFENLNGWFITRSDLKMVNMNLFSQIYVLFILII
ncbi:MAG: hypothetical protein MZV64_03360 [Ignavibacteriales bacterium]|nr:hypothetical protein [Ignavibacteriales bacterium]